MKQQLILAVPEVYYQVLGDDEIGYADVTTLQMLTHLDNTYGSLTEDDLERNVKLMHSPWSIQEPIETLFARLKSCRTFASSCNEPIPEPSAVRAGLQILEATNQFPVACQEWRDKATPLNKTMQNFVIHFSKADVSRKRTLTSRDAGFHRAAQVQDTPTKATGIRCLEISSQGTTSKLTSAHSANSVNSNSSSQKSKDPEFFYCWTHGVSTNPAHTSRTCNNKQPRHDDSATMDDMKGGCNIIQRKQNERQIYVRPERKSKSPPSTSS